MKCFPIEICHLISRSSGGGESVICSDVQGRDAVMFRPPGPPELFAFSQNKLNEEALATCTISGAAGLYTIYIQLDYHLV